MMFRPILLTILLFFTLNVTPSSAQNNPTLAFSGDALNVSVGVSDQVAMVITDVGDNEFTATGTFANNTLFGSFRSSGVAQNNCTPAYFCLHFDGVLEGLEAGGFDDGTVTSYSMTLIISKDTKTARGTYRTGVLPSYVRDQNGTLDLSAPKN